MITFMLAVVAEAVRVAEVLAAAEEALETMVVLQVGRQTLEVAAVAAPIRALSMGIVLLQVEALELSLLDMLLRRLLR